MDFYGGPLRESCSLAKPGNLEQVQKQMSRSRSGGRSFLCHSEGRGSKKEH